MPLTDEPSSLRGTIDKRGYRGPSQRNKFMPLACLQVRRHRFAPGSLFFEASAPNTTLQDSNRRKLQSGLDRCSVTRASTYKPPLSVAFFSPSGAVSGEARSETRRKPPSLSNPSAHHRCSWRGGVVRDKAQDPEVAQAKSKNGLRHHQNLVTIRRCSWRRDAVRSKEQAPEATFWS